VPNDPAARHGWGHSKLLRDGLIGESLRAEPVGYDVEIGAALAASLPAHVPDGIRDPAAKKEGPADRMPAPVYWRGLPKDAPASGACQKRGKFKCAGSLQLYRTAGCLVRGLSGPKARPIG
jgi:hypothetical protein